MLGKNLNALLGKGAKRAGVVPAQVVFEPEER